MGKIFYIMGKSSCGKDTIYKKLLSLDKCNLKRIVPYTTRPIRDKEQNGVDYYFIEYGANDFFNKIPIDKYNESTDEFNELHTYYGALSRGIEKLQALSPNATIILLTPFYGIYKDSMGTYLGDTYITSNGYGTLADYAKKMINISEDKGLYCFDGMFRSKHDLYLDTVDMYLMDTTHLSLLGRQAFARLLAHIPNSMEHYEPSAYRQCDFITISKFDPNETYRMPDNELEEYFNDEYQTINSLKYKKIVKFIS